MKTTNKSIISLSCKRTVCRILSISFMVAFCMVTMTTPAYAANLQNSTLYQGFINFLNDLMGAVAIICPIVCGLFAAYYLSRRGMADEQDGKGWMKRVYQAIGCGVGGTLVSGIIALITSYFTT